MMRYTIATPRRECMVNLDGILQEALRTSGVQEGLCHVFVPHTTAALTINENADPDVQRDILVHLRRMIPRDGDFHHGEGNSDAHIKSVLTGQGVTLIVSGGVLQLGTWQSVFLCEFDGPRTREVWIQIVPA